MDIIRTHDVKEYLVKKAGAGASVPEMVGALRGDEKDVRRLLSCLLGTKEIIRDKKNYYVAGCVPVKNRVAAKQPVEDLNGFIEGVDISKCRTSRQKVEALINSPEPLKRCHKFSVSERINDQQCNKMLYDFLHCGIKISEVNVMYDAARKQNIAIKKDRVANNRISIHRTSEREWQITKTDYLCPERPEIINLASWEDLEKCLRTFFKK